MDRKKYAPVALVTGASRGLGKQIALTLAGRGYSVVVNYLSSRQEAEGLAREIGGGSIAVRTDVSVQEEVFDMSGKIEEIFGRLDVIINNAGIAKDNLLLKQTEPEWDEIIGTNLKGCFNIIKIMSPVMIKSGGGHIINISSYSGLKGKAGQTAYSASKAAILGLTYTAAHELSEYNIRVNAVLPGYMMTDMGTRAHKAMERAKESSITRKLSDPEEVAGFILYLLKTKNISGQVFSLDSRII
ncbi:MAG: SDR family NAD(P)-dependent oxidoreductase [Nitrospirota bacterium]